jgi:DNA-binding transcriptional MerR regulator
LYDFVSKTNDQMRSTDMQIGDVAERTALTVDAIRFYERRKLLPKAARSAGRFRLYTEDAIERLRFIRQMQGLGFSLREVRELIQLRERKVDACESVRELLKAKLADVRAKQRELWHLESELEADLRKCNRELSHRRRHAACACPVLEVATGVSQ